MNWKKHATTDAAQVTKWWTHWPDANIGLVTGWPGGPGVVLDVDDPTLINEMPGALTCTRIAGTGGGGQHLFFALPDGVELGNGTGNLPKGRADVRGCGSGYVIAPPSVHPNGNDYYWRQNGEPAVMDSQLLEVIQGTREWTVPMDFGTGLALGSSAPYFDAAQVDTAPHEPTPVDERARRWLERREPAISGSGGHTWTFETAQFLTRGFDLDPCAAADLMLGAWNSSCQPPWNPKEIQRKCREARSKGTMIVGSQLEDSRALPSSVTVGYPPIALGPSLSPAPIAPPWPARTPLQVDGPQLPPFPIDVMPTWSEEWVDAVAESTQTPPELAGMLALVCASAALAKKAVVRIKLGWIEPLNLWVVVAMVPSSRKSPVFAAATAPLREYEQQQCTGERAHEIAMARHRAEGEADLLKTHKRKLARFEDPAERGALISKIEDQQRALITAEAKIPSADRMLAQDATPEALIGLMATNGGRIAVLSDEGAVLGIAAGLYNAGKANIDALLQGYSGGDIRVDRRTREPEYVQAAALTLGLTVQVEVLRETFANKALRGRGLLARPMYVIPPSNVGSRESALKTPAVPEVLTQEYRAGLMALCGIATPEDGPIELTLAKAAKKSLASWDAGLELELGKGGRWRHISEWAAKLTGALIRVAGILHIADHGPEGEIDGDTMWRAIRLGNWLLEHASLAFESMGDSSAGAEVKAGELLEWMALRPAPITRRSIQQTRRRHFKDADELDAMLKLLVESGEIRQVAASPQAFEVRPAEEAVVNEGGEK